MTQPTDRDDPFPDLPAEDGGLTDEVAASLDLDPESRLEAVYQLEAWVRCPACRESIEAVGIVRLLRTKVNFISTLPRKGYLAVCPQCRTVLPAEVSGLV